MNLFELKNHKLTFSPQALELAPFKVLWQRDKSKNKEKAIKELTYIWYMDDHRSDFFDIIDEEERSKEILSLIDLPNNWKADDKVNEARNFYRDRSDTISVKMLKNTMSLLEKVNTMLGNIDPNETYRDAQGNIKHVYDLKKIVDVAKQIPSLIESFEKTVEQVKKEDRKESTMRGSMTKSTFEDGI